MHIFVDESGTFVRPLAGHSISVVGALIVPDRRLPYLNARYERLRRALPKEGGEVKGRRLSEREIAQVIDTISKVDLLFEVTAIDLGLHPAEDLAIHKRGQEEGLTVRLTAEHHPNVHADLQALRRRLEAMPEQLYVQSVCNFELVHRSLEHGAMYFSQRLPRELAAYHWVIDAKDRNQVTDWEDWWSFVVKPMLQSRSLERPMRMIEFGDYSHQERFVRPVPDYLQPNRARADQQAVDLNLMISESLRFSADPEPCLEIADILTNAIRRAMSGNLRLSGFARLPRLMVHRNPQYVQMIALSQRAIDGPHPYRRILRYLSRAGKSMIAERFAHRMRG